MRELINTGPVEGLASAGYYLALRVGFAFPLVEINNLPENWIDQYTKQRFMLFDPVIRWVYSNNGSIRWSAVDLPDPRKIMVQAASFGLRYGVVVSYLDGTEQGQRSFGSFARADREFTDDEIAQLEEMVICWHRETEPPSNLTKAELEALRMVRSGMRTKQIAYELGVSEGAVKQRLRNAKTKLNAQTGTEAATKAQGFGLL